MSSPRRYLYFSFAAGLATLVLKLLAWQLTGSIGLYSDALESLVNLAAAVGGFWALTLSARPADADHHFGHDKAEFFASGLEGGLILFAALAIAYSALPRLWSPPPLARLDLGLGLSVLASLLNGAVGWQLWRAGRRLDNIVLEADGQHLLTDVWTSFGVVAGLLLAQRLPPAYAWIDPLLALLVAGNIVRTAIGLLRRSCDGLMDKALPADEEETIRRQVAASCPLGRLLQLRTRKAGATRFVEIILLLPGDWTLAASHQQCDQIEARLAQVFAGCRTTVHVEPLP